MSERDELLARFRWFVETGDMKQWAGPGATVDDLREAVRADVAVLLALVTPEGGDHGSR